MSLVVCLTALVPLVAAPSATAEDQATQQLQFGTDMAKRGLWSEALFRFRQASRLDPGNARILNNVAVAYEALGLFDQALEAYRQALAVSPSDRELRENYSSFVDFYQNFRPPEEREAEAEAGGDSSPAEEAQ